MKTVLEFINALTGLGIVGFLIYFFIYYRTSMKSVLDAIGDTDSLKAGSCEFKRRKQLDESVKTIKSEPKSEPKSETLSEENLLQYKKQFVSLSNFALMHSAGIAETKYLKVIINNRNKVFENVCLSDSNYSSELSEENAFVDAFVDKKLKQSKP